jgi:glucose-1-phosphate thymidylyltransferase
MKKNDFCGIVLAGGSGSRLFPITKAISKQLIPIFDKPLIYYPISTLMLAGIRDILIICTENDLDSFKRLLGDGSSLGVSFQYIVQDEPRGIAEAFILGSDFIALRNVCLILGDNIFYGSGISAKLKEVCSDFYGATVFGHHVSDPQRFGVAEIDDNNKVIRIEEKPKNPSSNLAITGLYFYDNDVVDIARNLKPSNRNELEITDVNNSYLNKNNLNLEILPRGHTWLDTGTVPSLHEAANFVQAIQTQQGFMIACLEEIAYKQKWISKEALTNQINKYDKSSYGNYLKRIYQVL